MKKSKNILLIALIIICTHMAAGCWNYREVEQLAIVAGVAIDKDGDNNYLVTVELVGVDQNQRESAMRPVYVQAVGSTFFDAVRSMVPQQGKKLYWSHTKAVIISEDIAAEGINKVLDFMNRDAEIREDMWVLLSKECMANEIFNTVPAIEKILSFQIDDTLRAQKTVSSYPAVELYKLLDMLAKGETSAVIPTISNIKINGKPTIQIQGSAIIKGSKLNGFLDSYESKSLLWIIDELKGGLYIVKNPAGTGESVSLELYRSKTKVRSVLENGRLVMRVSLTVDASIGEITGREDFTSEKGRAVLEGEAEKQIKKELEDLIEKAQKEYKSDFLGFGETISKQLPAVWRSIETSWGDIFADIDSVVEVKVRIKGSATAKEPVKVGEE